MRLKYLIVAILIAAYMTVGMPVLGSASIQIAIAAVKYGWINTSLAPQLAWGITSAPVLLMVAIALAYCASFLRKVFERDFGSPPRHSDDRAADSTAAEVA